MIVRIRFKDWIVSLDRWTGSLDHLLAFILVFTSLLHSSESRTQRCYSCMSDLHGSVWGIYSNIYQQQQDFTKKCDDPESAKGLQWKACDSSCIKVEDFAYLMGTRVRLSIRGCYNNIFKFGFNRSSVIANRMEYRDFCSNISLTFLAEGVPKDYQSHFVNACSCHGDLCNESTSKLRSSRTGTILLPILFAILSYFISLS